MANGLSSMIADGAYDTLKCHDVIAERGAYAVSLCNSAWTSIDSSLGSLASRF
ncbi:hypothetical protein [Oceaniglobus indicus]|uniref:hypothetical protein n=1 Tax=Oceaniglobus indicus TaxID=2047749 RepID=UPI0014768031|nr:hypothetical protein [Oceaniglobus indicus]